MSKIQQRGDRRGRERRGRDDYRDQASREEKNQYLERVVAIDRVAKAVQGGRRFSSAALVVVGDSEGTAGVSYGKAEEMLAVITEGVEEARKHFFYVPLIQRTIPRPAQGRKAVGMVLLRPISPGTGVIAGGSARTVLECAGVHDVLAESLGSANAINVVHTMADALQQLKEPEVVTKHHGLLVGDIAPAVLLRTRKEEVAG